MTRVIKRIGSLTVRQSQAFRRHLNAMSSSGRLAFLLVGLSIVIHFIPTAGMPAKLEDVRIVTRTLAILFSALALFHGTLHLNHANQLHDASMRPPAMPPAPAEPATTEAPEPTPEATISAHATVH